jgi:LysM repeat protein
MNTISRLLNWELEEIKSLNPIYKTTFIPKSEKGRCITGPHHKISTLAGMEDSLYRLEKSIYAPVIIPQPVVIPPTVNDTLNGELGSSNNSDSLAPTVPLYLSYHKVKSQENLKNIALKYNVTVENLMEWNALRSTSIYVGQKLKVYTAEAPQVVPTPTPPAPAKKYYNVRSGDTFGKIAQRHNMTLEQLKKINPGINISRLTVGQRIRVK